MKVFLLSSLENKSLKKSTTDTLLNFGGVSGVIRLGAGPKSPSKFGFKNVAIDNLSFSEFTIALCSMLLYCPFVTI